MSTNSLKKELLQGFSIESTMGVVLFEKPSFSKIFNMTG